LTGTGIRATWVLWLAAGLQFVSFQWHVSLTVPVFALVGAWLMVNVPRRRRPVQVAAALRCRRRDGEHQASRHQGRFHTASMRIGSQCMPRL
jgi:hypothetical protein